MLECGMNHLEAEFCSNVDVLERNIKSGTVKSFKKINDYSETLIVFKARQNLVWKNPLQIGFTILDFAKLHMQEGKNYK